MNVNLPRWVFASLAKHFADVTATIPELRYYVEGVDEPEPGDFQNDAAAFKMDGPIAHQGSGTNWYSLEIMILLTDIISQTNDSAYKIYEWAGIYQANLLNEPLSIFRYGDGPDDDQSLIGCLSPDTRVKNNVRVVSYGNLDKDLRIKQMSVNGRFILCPN